MTLVPLTPAQAGVWFTEEAGFPPAAYHLPLTVEFRGPLDGERLRAACAAVVDRHPLLASVVRVDDGVPGLAPGPRPELEIVDLAAAGDAGAALERFVRARITEPFDHAAGPPARFALARLTPARHVLVVVAHHLVFDGRSKDVFLTDLAAAYAGADLPEAAPDPVAPDDADGADDTDGADDEGARRFWAGRWRAPDPVLLPGSGPSAAGDADKADKADEAGHVALAIGPDLRADLGAAAQRLGATPFEVVLTAVRAVLRRYGNERTTVAVDLDTRRPEDRRRIGMFVNQVPVEGPLSSEDPFREAVAATRAALREVYPFRTAPLARAVPGLPPGPALAPVSVSYRRQTAAPHWPDGIRADVDWMPFNAGAHDLLHLQMVDAPEGLRGRLSFRPSALTPAAAERIAGHVTTLLRAAIDEPGAAIGRLALLPAAEVRRLAGWNDTTVATRAGTVVEWIAEQARLTPDSVAVESDGPDGARLTYAALADRAGRFAAWLRQAGVGPGDVVGVLSRRSGDLAVAVLAALRAGAAFLPLDPDLPADRLAFMLDDTGARFVLTASRLAPRLAGSSARAVLLEQVPLAPDDGPAPAGLADPAYVIYTSGSTGTPKGVVNSHRGLANRLDWMQRRYPLRGDDAVLQKTPIGFDVSVWELLWPLMTGARLVMAAPDGHRDPRYLRDVIVGRGITTTHFVPSMLAAFLEEPDVEGCGSLRRTICSGEELTPPLAARFLARVPGELHNLYGPTEAAIDVTAWPCTPAEVEAAGRLPIGRPIQNMRAHVLDPAGGPAPIGVAGELVVAGPGVALGYLNRPELTRERFVPEPGGSEPAYRTGDRARFRDDGNLEYLGRIDRQLKVRGNRVEPGEIEAALTAQAGVVQAAVLMRDQRLVAYLVTDRPVPAETLRDALARRLPDFMVPASFTVLDEPPLTPSGKLDHRALAAPPQQPAPAARPGADGDLLGEVAAIWAEVLGVPEVGPDDDLFDLGGHSLTVTQISVRMRRRLGIDLPLHVFYDAPTVKELVAAAEAGR